MAVVDAFDRAVSFPFPELRGLPPNRMRIRVGVGNRLVFNQVAFLEFGAGTVVDLLSDGYLTRDARVVDIGCGCGRFPHALARYGFRGSYDGIDVDAEMVQWCRSHFPGDKYRFHVADVFSTVYNPTGKRAAYRLPLEGSTADLVLGQSLFTHLLEDELASYVRESARVLVEGSHMFMGVFSLEEMAELGLLGGRWSFQHAIGRARVESLELPEAAVAYERSFLLGLCEEAGFADAWVVPREPQSLLIARR
jgi:SAM-dependent methyltransferase